ncbi:dihydroxyacetone kinase subunit DhaK [Corynebacterium hansenii]|uniref:Dihydroxyacetone kinase subunit DhaK n=1 Tax=Corynebacterium hansenii TaxID=394964 RepID=A0ABV7ZPH5_9CORY|nr:dihydroxyacetone kinase subunit DhaK [Corynebacterium hansenii]WJZ01048.1 PTS-dependent dihydroxyacetone kinase, dihydroxyacetone-binding subunit DhaK [Corynebacterium hansenii]
MGAFFDDATTPYRLGLAGMVAGRSDIAWRDRGFLELTDRKKGVALVSGGGSGHEPLHAGFLGEGMLGAVCPGHIFTSPNARQVLEATRAVDDGSGVVHVVKNYTGDVMNFGVAAALAAEEGIRVETVLVGDDVATDLGDGNGDGGGNGDGDGVAGGSGGPGRRGTGATILVEKACGAAAARGAELGVVADVGRNVARRARSIAMSLGGARTPGSAESFSLADDEAEFGVGIHGERGVDRRKRMSVEDAVAEMIDEVHGAAGSPDRVLVLANGLGGIAGLELEAILALACGELESRGARIERTMCGNYITAWDMAGFSLTVLGVDDDLLDLLDAPTSAPAWDAPAPYSGVPEISDGALDDLPAADSGPAQPELSAWVERVLAASDELTELDRKAGDGDFGVNMREALAPFDLPLRGTVGAVLHALGESYLVRAGGTSGAVFGLFFATMGATAGDAESLSDVDLAAVARAGLDAVVELGGAQVGDGTVVDAIEPAVLALEDGGTLADAAHHAATGAEATADRVAGKGRASYVGDAAKGVADPGALVMARFFEALAG